jgi:phosphoribosylformylglycinamidine synthase
MCGARGLPATRIGVVDGDTVEIQGEFSLTLEELRKAHEETIPALLA